MQKVFFVGLYISFLIVSFLVLQFEKTSKTDGYLNNKTELYKVLKNSHVHYASNVSEEIYDNFVTFNQNFKNTFHLDTFLFVDEKFISKEQRYQKPQIEHYYGVDSKESFLFSSSVIKQIEEKLLLQKVFTIYDKKTSLVVTIIPLSTIDSKEIPAFILIKDDATPMKTIEFDFAILLVLVYGFSFIVLIFVWKLNQKKIEIDKLMNIMSDNVNFIRTSPNGTIKEVSKAFCKIYGYEESEVILQKYNMLIHPDLSQTYKDHFWKKKRLHNGWKGRVKQLTKDGTLLWMQVVINPEINGFGKIDGYLVVTTNITDAVHLKELSKELEIEMNKNKEKDNIYINQLISHQLELSTSLIAQKEGEKSKDLFLANMSHEIRTPLNGIIGFLSLLQQTSLTKQQKEYLEMSQNSSKILLTIINDILDFSKMSAGKFDLDLQPNKCKVELMRAADIFRSQMKQKGLNFIVDIDENIPECVMCDANRQKQVFINLLGNAMKFTKEGEVIFSVKVLEQTEQKATIRYSVKDTGIGIPKEKQSLIFEAFSQADKFIGTKFGGTGLGISIASNIIALAGGKLQLISEVNKGSEFYFVLTIQKCDPELTKTKTQHETVSEVIQYKKNHILVAEDNKTNQMLIEILLNNRGLESTICENGEIAVETYKKDPKRYALILMDIQMPIKDGLMATSEILDFEKENSIEHTKIVALTANAIIGDREKYFANGMDDYLPKPIDSKELDKVLQRYLPIDIKLATETIDPNADIEVEFDDIKEVSVEVLYDVDMVANEFGMDRKSIYKLLKTFFQNYNENKEELWTVCKGRDFDNIKRICHFLKGSSGSIKLQKVFELTKEMEYEALQKNEFLDWESKLATLENSVEEYKNYLNNFIKNNK